MLPILAALVLLAAQGPPEAADEPSAAGGRAFPLSCGIC